jgi:DNA-binding transcriptional MocR family regulator
LAAATAKVLRSADTAALMAYRPIGGGAAERAAGAAWLEPALGRVDPRRVLVAPGAQAALVALMTMLARPKAVILVDPLTFPGLLSAARRLDLTLVPVPGDSEGMSPDALDRACREHAPAALYLVPTLHNPTTVTMDRDRRRAVAEIARARDVAIVEDDAYGLLPDGPPEALAQSAPERTWYVSTLSKVLSPGLRAAFVVAPHEGGAEDLAGALRVVAGMVSPLASAVVADWIREGVAANLLAGVRAEAAARMRLAREILPGALGGPNGIHLWLDLPARWNRLALAGVARGRGLSLTPADVFSSDGRPPNGVRLSLGAARDLRALGMGLRSLADILRADAVPSPAHSV